MDPSLLFDMKGGNGESQHTYALISESGQLLDDSICTSVVISRGYINARLCWVCSQMRVSFSVELALVELTVIGSEQCRCS